jgi:hypothetical protein
MRVVREADEYLIEESFQSGVETESTVSPQLPQLEKLLHGIESLKAYVDTKFSERDVFNGECFNCGGPVIGPVIAKALRGGVRGWSAEIVGEKATGL